MEARGCTDQFSVSATFLGLNSRVFKAAVFDVDLVEFRGFVRPKWTLGCLGSVMMEVLVVVLVILV